jgi:hypothetical protein
MVTCQDQSKAFQHQKFQNSIWSLTPLRDGSSLKSALTAIQGVILMKN